MIAFVKFANLQFFPLASFARSYSLTVEALIAESTVCSPCSFFPMNVFYAFERSTLVYSFWILLKTTDRKKNVKLEMDTYIYQI